MNKLCLHQSICIMAYLQKVHLYHDTPTRVHLHHGIPTRVHLHHDTLTRVHLHHGTPTKVHLHHGIPTTGYLHHKNCISEKRHMHHMDISHLHPYKKHLHQKKSRLASHFVCIHRKSTSRLVVQSLSGAQCLHITLVRPIMAFHLYSWRITFAFCILLKMRKNDEKNW